jgi:hypothetical protein
MWGYIRDLTLPVTSYFRYGYRALHVFLYWSHTSITLLLLALQRRAPLNSRGKWAPCGGAFAI